MADSIDSAERALMKRWVDQWKFVTGPELERIKKEELRAMTDEEGQADTEMLLSTSVCDWAPAWRETSSGLVEQQRWFSRWARRE